MSNTKPKDFHVTFLFDRSNDWIEKYINIGHLKKLKSLKKYKFHKSKKYSSIVNQDIVFILGYTRILSKSFLKRNRLCLVSHESNLPKGKGFAPVQWQVLENKKVIPIMLIEAISKVDSGKIYSTQNFRLNGTELFHEIRKKQGLATFKIIKKFLSEYPKVYCKSQSGKETYYRKRNTNDSRLDINLSIKDQFNLLRIVDNENWPAFFHFKNKIFNIKISEKK